MFYYCLVNPGFEKFLKDEAAHRYPGLHPAFSRPGFVTFKSVEDAPVPSLVFSRCTGLSLLKCTASELEDQIGLRSPGRRVHRFSLETLRTEGEFATVGTQVLDVVQTARDEYWLGARTVGPFEWGFPAGLPHVELPAEAPSRAYLKLEETLLWTGYTPEEGTIAVELGSAPGGASYALLKRGVNVTGIDLAPVSPVCVNHPRYSHVSLSIRDVRKKNLPSRFPLLFCDLGLKPIEAIPQIRHLCQIFPVERVFYTLKLGEGMSFKTLEGHFEAFRKLGFTVRATHLPSNRMDLLVAAVRPPSAAQKV